jgi:hypothetical protein
MQTNIFDFWCRWPSLQLTRTQTCPMCRQRELVETVEDGMNTLQPPLSLQANAAIEGKLLESEEALRSAQQALIESGNASDPPASPLRAQAAAEGEVITDQQRTLLVIGAYKHSLEVSEAELGEL